MKNEYEAEKLMYWPLTKMTYCLYVDEAENPYFCIEDFVRENRLPDSPALRLEVLELAEEMYPGIMIVDSIRPMTDDS